MNMSGEAAFAPRISEVDSIVQDFEILKALMPSSFEEMSEERCREWCERYTAIMVSDLSQVSRWVLTRSGR